jgi:hypothetical protein
MSNAEKLQRKSEKAVTLQADSLSTVYVTSEHLLLQCTASAMLGFTLGKQLWHFQVHHCKSQE